VKVVFAIETVSLLLQTGESLLLRKGTHWPADDPLVREYPQWFADNPRYGLSWTGTPPPEMAEPPVEQVTAAPGEKRA